MKKILCLVSGVFLCAGVSAETKIFPMLGGFSNVKIVSVDAEGVRILHDDGIDVIGEDDLSPEEKKLVEVQLEEVTKQQQLKQEGERQGKRLDAMLELARQEKDPKKAVELLQLVKDCTLAPRYGELVQEIAAREKEINGGGVTPPEKVAENPRSPAEERSLEIKIRRAKDHLRSLNGRLKILNGDLDRAVKRERNSEGICRRKHGDVDSPPFNWSDYNAEKKACCKAYKAAWIQRDKLEKSVKLLQLQISAQEASCARLERRNFESAEMTGDFIDLEIGLDHELIIRLVDGALVADPMGNYGGVGTHHDLRYNHPGLYFGRPACRVGERIWELNQPLPIAGHPEKIRGVELLQSSRSRVSVGDRQATCFITWDERSLFMGDHAGSSARYKVRVYFELWLRNAGFPAWVRFITAVPVSYSAGGGKAPEGHRQKNAFAGFQREELLQIFSVETAAGDRTEFAGGAGKINVLHHRSGFKRGVFRTLFAPDAVVDDEKQRRRRLFTHRAVARAENQCVAVGNEIQFVRFRIETIDRATVGEINAHRITRQRGGDHFFAVFPVDPAGAPKQIGGELRHFIFGDRVEIPYGTPHLQRFVERGFAVAGRFRQKRGFRRSDPETDKKREKKNDMFLHDFPSFHLSAAPISNALPATPPMRR
ncbi:MAG: hypothetical protein MJ016_01395 [Victivallaceae bacterium]|nr:hypothetical protein [Victivallaceae bacterium]